MTSGAFDTLVSCMRAIVRKEHDTLRGLMRECVSGALLRQAVRHRCEGLLLDGMLAANVRNEVPPSVLLTLKQYAQRAVVQNALLVQQIADVVRAMRDGGVTHALLKTGARLYAGDAYTRSTAICDVDVLIRGCDAARAATALLKAGYRTETALAAAYEARHHHLAPFYGEGLRKPVELHVALAPPGKFSTQSDWTALADRMRPIDGPGGTTLALDVLGAAMHRVLHGVGLYRLYDVAVLALDMRENPWLPAALTHVFEREATQSVGARAVIASASRIAGVDSVHDPDAAAYLRWVSQREELPAFLRLRSQFADAYFGNGQHVAGPCTPLARAQDFFQQPSVGATLAAAYRSAGRAVAGFVAMGYPKLRRR